MSDNDFGSSSDTGGAQTHIGSKTETQEHQDGSISDPDLTDEILVSGSSQNESNFGADLEPDRTSQMSDMAHHRLKWKHRRPQYNDAYLNLFKRNQFELRDDNAFGDELSDSQLGVVTWTAEEKAVFFTALARYGRHDLPRISNIIGTKSQIEVKDYIDLLHESFVDRQRFRRSTKNASQAEFPAAIEVGAELEAKLDEAADAVDAAQEEYDFAAGQQKAGELWLVGRHNVANLDAATALMEQEMKSMNENATRTSTNSIQGRPKHSLFRLGNWLDLAEKFFMNFPHGTGHEHWSHYVHDDQSPALTMDAVTDLHNLAVSLTQRILQVTIFMAKSRIRALMVGKRLPTKIITQEDVASAIDVLGMQHDCWDFWRTMSRRRNFNIIDRERRQHRKFSGDSVALSDAEAFLSRASARRRTRSLSRSLSRSRARSTSAGPATLSDTDSMTGSVEESNESSEEDQDEGRSSTTSNQDDSDSDGSMSAASSTHASAGFVARGMKRRLALEEAQDEYMERLDQKARKREEASLWQLFGQSPSPSVKEESNEALGVRPKTLRKDEDELLNWSCSYQAEWEYFGRTISPLNRSTTVPEEKDVEVSGLLE